MILALDPDTRQPVLKPGRKPGEAASHPLGLYLKAHVVGQKVERAELLADGFALHMRPSGNVWELEFRDGKLAATVRRAEEPAKPYRQTLALAAGTREQGPGEVDESAPVALAPQESPEERRLRKKRERLLENVRRDRDGAREWLDRFAPVLKRLMEEPRAWAEPEVWSIEERALLDEEIRQQKLPPFGAKNLGSAQKALFEERRRLERKQKLAGDRLAKLEREPEATRAKRASPAPAAAGAPVSRRPSKKPGVWVEISDNLWARVGRSASENDELFRQAKDRDLWFHVRGQAGAHVWIPRGQPELGAKAEASEKILRLGCQLALINSKASESGSAFVDFTERRYLKKIAGTEGAVRILRSEARDTRLDEAFERRVMKNGG